MYHAHVGGKGKGQRKFRHRDLNPGPGSLGWEPSILTSSIMGLPWPQTMVEAFEAFEAEASEASEAFEAFEASEVEAFEAFEAEAFEAFESGAVGGPWPA